MNRRQRRAGGRRESQGRAAGGAAAPIAAWFRAALDHQRAGRAAEAKQICRRILSIQPGHSQTLHLLGLIEHQQGRSEDAIKHIRNAIERDDRDPAFHHNLGNILRARERYAEAMTCYERALALAPASVDTLYNLANICQDLGLRERAIACFERALRIRPDAVELHNNLGTALQDLGRLDEAIACYRNALRLRPDAVEVLDNLGGALRARRQLDAAQACYERALALRPDRVESHIGLGIVLRDRGRLEDAVARYQQALKLAPDHPETRNNLGVALADLGQLKEAIAHYQRALAIRPDCAETRYNLGVALEREGRYGAAIASYERALAVKPDYAPAHLNRALALLLTGEFEQGWKEYEWRFAAARYDRGFGRPLWRGEPLGGRRILIHAEQGFGDTLQFVRYVPAVAERGGTVVLEVPQALVRLVRSVAGASQIVVAGDPLPPFECHCPLLSLPRVFDTRLTTIPNAVPYLAPPTEASLAWAGRLAAASGLKVGVVWAGTTVGAIDLRLLEPLWKVGGVSWFSLQAGSPAADISSLDGVVDITDLSPWLTDFAETAAAVCQLDMVITVDTSVAHLSGALGRPTWILLPAAADWRWLIEREDSPWYPTARLFRQKRGEDWHGVARAIAAALAPIARPSLVPRGQI
jgi:tetratricopeptide (TPR) repeat protein